ncbi:hypothetical protein ACJRO7_013018 [Eucalyptus globulus]|uniref:CASP-like protein n=1 Tax=Eucalyptus globulus TaxID=34317 RepID=A0ABD3LKL4_EUCGL
MDSSKNGAATPLSRSESKVRAKGKAIAAVAPPPVAATKAGRGGWKKGVAVFDFLLRLFATGATLAAAATMGTTDQTLSFFTQFFQFQASYDDLPAFTFFVIANAGASAYLVLSLPFSIVCTIFVALTMAAASSAAAIVYLAQNANWLAICRQFNDFCQEVSDAVVASSVAALIFIFLVVLSTISLKRL